MASTTNGVSIQNNSVNITQMQWKKDSWRNKNALQFPEYPDEKELESVLKTIETFPPLVLPNEARHLEEKLAEVAMGRAFLLQGGDCAESFTEFGESKIGGTYHTILQMASILLFGGQMPVVKVGRIAGQFAKPRSQAFEERDGVKLTNYKGDMVNGLQFSPESRKPDPQRMLRAYFQSAATLNLLRSLEAMEASEFYSSHECLLLPYEERLTRIEANSGQHYNCSAHMLWVGERTRQLDGAHVEFLRGIANPIGIKVSEKMEPWELVKLCKILNPENKPGRVTVIVIMGADNLRLKLPHLIRTVNKAGIIVIWVTDPLHRNAIQAPCGLRTRDFSSIIVNVKAFFDVHEAEDSHPGGIHLEMTGQDVTECVGGGRAKAVTMENLPSMYYSHCDPRLNACQSLELAMVVAELLWKRRLAKKHFST